MEKCRSGMGISSNSTMRRMTSRGVKCSPASSPLCSEKRRSKLLVDVAHLQPGELVGAELEFLVLVQDRGEPVVLHHLADRGPSVPTSLGQF